MRRDPSAVDGYDEGDDDDMDRRPGTQSKIISTIKWKIEKVLARPTMYAGDDANQLCGLLTGYFDALAMVCAPDYRSAFIFGSFSKHAPKPETTTKENVARLVTYARSLLERVPQDVIERLAEA